MSDLDLVRAQRQVTNRRVAALSAEARKELLSRKREKQLTRVLLPDAPPRKRRVQRPSPDRESCEFIDSESGDDSNRIVILENRQVAPPMQDNTGDVHIPDLQVAAVSEPGDLLRAGTVDAVTIPNLPSSLDSDPGRLRTFFI
ncbi:uncharacterized protein LOC123690333 [Pieris rapae]|nr:uncharacterized protein LOC123690333 [Pieris rapae]